MKKCLSIAMIFMMLGISNINGYTNSEKRRAAQTITFTNLYDAFGKEIAGVRQDFGFSTIVKYKGKTILFDAGTNAKVFESNLRKMKVDLRKVDIAIISHGHYDHIGGMDYLLKVNPRVKIYLPRDFFSIGAPTMFPFREPEPGVAGSLSKDEQYFRGSAVVEGMITEPTGRFWRSNIEYLTKVTEVLPGVTVVPTTASLMGTFVRYPPFDKEPQLIGMPELSVSFASEQGQIIVSGCSHTGIEKIIQEISIVKKEKILLVTGGFHLIPYGRDYIETLATRMRDKYDVEFVAPAHCSGHMAFSIFREVFGNKYRFFGLGESISL